MGLVVWLIAVTGITFVRGFLIKTFWSWFVAAQFPNLPTPSLVACIGLSMFLGVLTPAKWYTQVELDTMREGDPGAVSFSNLVLQLFASALTLGIGWLIHSLM